MVAEEGEAEGAMEEERPCVAVTSMVCVAREEEDDDEVAPPPAAPDERGKVHSLILSLLGVAGVLPPPSSLPDPLPLSSWWWLLEEEK